MKSLPLVRSTVWLTDKGQGGEVGTYASSPRSEPSGTLVATAVECPYCHGVLLTRETTREARRIVMVLETYPDRKETLQAVIPNTHMVLRCEPCDARFVSPRVTA